MKFLKPTVLTIALFGLLCFPFLICFLSEKLFRMDIFVELPGPVASPTAFVYSLSVGPLFVLLEKMGLELGYLSGWYGYPFLNDLGWVLIGGIHLVVYYLLAAAIARKIPQARRNQVVTGIVILIAVYAAVVSYGVTKGARDRPRVVLSKKCAGLATDTARICYAKCRESFPLKDPSSGDAYRKCAVACDLDRTVFVKQCSQVGAAGSKRHERSR